jgi:hypothetical protein
MAHSRRFSEKNQAQRSERGSFSEISTRPGQVRRKSRSTTYGIEAYVITVVEISEKSQISSPDSARRGARVGRRYESDDCREIQVLEAGSIRS